MKITRTENHHKDNFELVTHLEESQETFFNDHLPKVIESAGTNTANSGNATEIKFYFPSHTLTYSWEIE